MSAKQPYRPANGSEGCAFYEEWCTQCARDKPMSQGIDIDDCDEGEVCQIIADTQAFDIDSPKYPPEWIYQDGRPCCTAFVPVGEEIRTRCPLTADMFGADQSTS